MPFKKNQNCNEKFQKKPAPLLARKLNVKKLSRKLMMCTKMPSARKQTFGFVFVDGGCLCVSCLCYKIKKSNYIWHCLFFIIENQTRDCCFYIIDVGYLQLWRVLHLNNSFINYLVLQFYCIIVLGFIFDFGTSWLFGYHTSSNFQSIMPSKFDTWATCPIFLRKCNQQN